MSNEEMNKKIEFIVEHQAKFAAEIEIMREIQAADAKLLREQDRRFGDALIGTLAIVGNLTEALTRTDENVRLVAEAQANLTVAQARTEERLNIFINVVERYISGNGGSELRT